jgi:hypothetical protein
MTDDDDDAVSCKVFGYYTAYAEGPVKALNAGYLGCSSLLNDAELLMRKTTYPYEFFVVEFPRDKTIVSRYYDGHRHLRFESYRNLN